MLKKFRRMYRKYWNATLPVVLGSVGINPMHYQASKKVWSSKPVRKIRKRIEKLIKKSIGYVLVVSLVYYFIQNPEELRIMINHTVGNLTQIIDKFSALIAR